MKQVFLAVAALVLSGAWAASATPRDAFPRPPELERDVQFWIRVYSEVSTHGGFIHDSKNLGVVYEILRFPEGLSSRARQQFVNRAKKRYRRTLLNLARGKRDGLSQEEERVLGLWPEGVSRNTLRSAARHLRFQLGQADKFRAGLVRSGAWESHIRETFEDMGLPAELAVLPHVESSYTAHAYSRVGAAGLWQFTRSTGRRHMRVDHVVDERLDPFRSTLAAAQLLEQNYKTTGTWPLAITAYNHGASGVRRAARKLGTSDIATIVRKYRSRTFGFASRNFYVEFLAATEVDFNSVKYFGPIAMDTPTVYETAKMPAFASAAVLQSVLGVDPEILRQSNPALRPAVWTGSKYIPRGFGIRVSREHLSRPLAEALADIPSEKRFARQLRDSFHTVNRGDTLSKIAGRYGVRVSQLVALNGLRSRNRIRAGQRLRLPDTGRAASRSRKKRSVAITPSLPPEGGVYVVRRGDTLAKIAARFGLDQADLVQANSLRNRHRIRAGQSLRVDVQGSANGENVDPHPHTVIALAEPRAGKELPAAAVLDPAPVERNISDPETLEGEVFYGPVLAADPADYSVAEDHSIEIQAAETLGHYAEWLDIRASQLRQLNHLRYSDPLVVGHRLQLDLVSASAQAFEERRLAYHRALQGDFFSRFEISGTRVHVTKPGDSIWVLAQRRYRVPLWLLRQYNPDLNFGGLHAGTRITVPLLKRHEDRDADPDPEVAGPEPHEAATSTAEQVVAGSQT